MPSGDIKEFAKELLKMDIPYSFTGRDVHPTEKQEEDLRSRKGTGYRREKVQVVSMIPVDAYYALEDACKEIGLTRKSKDGRESAQIAESLRLSLSIFPAVMKIAATRDDAYGKSPSAAVDSLFTSEMNKRLALTLVGIYEELRSRNPIDTAVSEERVDFDSANAFTDLI